jgi:hypothetical protein
LPKIWVLDTETKGTGANMVPLERVVRHGAGDAVPGFVFPERKPPATGSPEAREPRQFRVIDVMTRAVLADGVDARSTVSVLEGVRSVVDVTIYVWEPEPQRWRMLTFEESKALWEYRGRGGGRAICQGD